MLSNGKHHLNQEEEEKAQNQHTFQLRAWWEFYYVLRTFPNSHSLGFLILRGLLYRCQQFLPFLFLSLVEAEGFLRGEQKVLPLLEALLPVLLSQHHLLIAGQTHVVGDRESAKLFLALGLCLLLQLCRPGHPDRAAIQALRRHPGWRRLGSLWLSEFMWNPLVWGLGRCPHSFISLSKKQQQYLLSKRIIKTVHADVWATFQAPETKIILNFPWIAVTSHILASQIQSNNTETIRMLTYHQV